MEFPSHVRAAIDMLPEETFFDDADHLDIVPVSDVPLEAKLSEIIWAVIVHNQVFAEKTQGFVLDDLVWVTTSNYERMF